MMDEVKCKTCYYDGVCDEDIGQQSAEDECGYYMEDDYESEIDKIDEEVYRDGLKHRQQSYMNLVKEYDDD